MLASFESSSMHGCSPALEAVLQPLFEDVVVLRRCPARARILEAIDAEVGLEAHPVVQIPVHTEAEFVGMPVVRGNILGRLEVVEENTRLVTLDPGIAECELPGSPTASTAAGKFRAKHRVLDARRSVFRPALLGEQVGGGRVPSLESNGGQIGKSKSAEGQGADTGAIENRLHIFVAEAPWACQIRELTLVPPHIPVGLKLRQESEGGIWRSGARSEFIGKTARLAVGDRSTKGKFAETTVFLVAPGIEADSADGFRHAGGVVGGEAFPVERARPVLECSAVDVAVNGDAGAAKRGRSRRVKQRLQTALHEIDVRYARGQFLRERFLELPGLDLNCVVVFRVQVDIANDRAGGCGGINEEAELVVIAVISLETETAAAHGKSIGRAVVAHYIWVIGLDDIVRLNLD